MNLQAFMIDPSQIAGKTLAVEMTWLEGDVEVKKLVIGVGMWDGKSLLLSPNDEGTPRFEIPAKTFTRLKVVDKTTPQFLGKAEFWTWMSDEDDWKNPSEASNSGRSGITPC